MVEQDSHVVTVGNAVVERDDGKYLVTIHGRDLEQLERVWITGEEAAVFVDVMHMVERVSSTGEWGANTESVLDVYDAIVYIQAHYYAEKGSKTYRDELTELQNSERWQVTPEN